MRRASFLLAQQMKDGAVCDSVDTYELSLVSTRKKTERLQRNSHETWTLETKAFFTPSFLDTPV